MTDRDSAIHEWRVLMVQQATFWRRDNKTRILHSRCLSGPVTPAAAQPYQPPLNGNFSSEV